METQIAKWQRLRETKYAKYDAVIFPDGSFNHQHGIGAWAVRIWMDNDMYCLEGGERTCRSVADMELRAIVEGLLYVGPDKRCLVMTDYLPAVEWKTPWKKIIKQSWIWPSYVHLAETCNADIVRVPGHSSSKSWHARQHSKVDKRARLVMRKHVQEKVKDDLLHSGYPLQPCQDNGILQSSVS